MHRIQQTRYLCSSWLLRYVLKIISVLIRAIFLSLGSTKSGYFFLGHPVDKVYKLYIRPHLDYGDIIYHRFDPEMHFEITRKLEQVQYSAALAVTGTWRGTSRQKLYEEFGWETLYHRRWYRRLTHFFCLRRSKSPEYLFNEIPQERQLTYNLRNPHEQPPARTVRFCNTYF